MSLARASIRHARRKRTIHDAVPRRVINGTKYCAYVLIEQIGYNQLIARWQNAIRRIAVASADRLSASLAPYLSVCLDAILVLTPANLGR